MVFGGALNPSYWAIEKARTEACTSISARSRVLLMGAEDSKTLFYLPKGCDVGVVPAASANTDAFSKALEQIPALSSLDVLHPTELAALPPASIDVVVCFDALSEQRGIVDGLFDWLV